METFHRYTKTMIQSYYCSSFFSCVLLSEARWIMGVFVIAFGATCLPELRITSTHLSLGDVLVAEIPPWCCGLFPRHRQMSCLSLDGSLSDHYVAKRGAELNKIRERSSWYEWGRFCVSKTRGYDTSLLSMRFWSTRDRTAVWNSFTLRQIHANLWRGREHGVRCLTLVVVVAVTS